MSLAARYAVLCALLGACAGATTTARSASGAGGQDAPVAPAVVVPPPTSGDGAASARAFAEEGSGRKAPPATSPATSPAREAPAAVAASRRVPMPGAASVTLFEDSFEQYRNSTQLTAYNSVLPGRWIINKTGEGYISLSSRGAAHGSKAVRFTYTTGTEQQDRLLEAYVTDRRDPAVVVVSWYMRTQPGYRWYSGHSTGGQAHKIFVGNIGAEGDQGQRVLLQFARDGIVPAAMNACYSRMAYVPTPTWSIGDVLYKQNLNYPAFDILRDANDGQWHHYVTRITKATRRTRTSGNGRLEMWVDGTKIMEYIGDQRGRCEYGLVNTPSVRIFPDLHFPSVNGSVSAVQWLEFDHVRIYTP